MNRILLSVAVILATLSAKGQSVPSYIPTSGLQAWYPFNNNANNEYGTGKNGSVIGPAPTTDRFGNPNAAYRFDGDDDHITIDTTFFNHAWRNFTISFWMNCDTLVNPMASNHSQCMLNSLPKNGLVFDFNWGLSGKYSYWIGSNPSGSAWDILPGSQSRSNVSIHTWNHMVLQKKDDTAYSLYINGVLDSTYIDHTAPMAVYTRISLGNLDSLFPHEGFMGKLDDYGFWNSTLSPCEIKQLFRSSAHLFVTAQPANDTVAPAGTATFSITDTGTGNTYQWQVNTGTGFINISAGVPYTGIMSPSLTISPATLAMNGYQYRCIVTGAGGCTDSSGNGKLTISTLGVVQAANMPMTIIPNPATSMIRTSTGQKATIRVFSAIGKLLKEAQNTAEMNIAELPAGIYFIKLFDDKGACAFSGQIVKR